MQDKKLNAEQPEYRGMGTDLVAAAVTGVTAGTANALANQAINALRKPNDDTPKKD